MLLVNTEAVVTTTIRLRFDCDSTDIRLPLTAKSTALLPFDDLHYDRAVSLRLEEINMPRSA